MGDGEGKARGVILAILLVMPGGADGEENHRDFGDKEAENQDHHRGLGPNRETEFLFLFRHLNEKGRLIVVDVPYRKKGISGQGNKLVHFILCLEEPCSRENLYCSSSSHTGAQQLAYFSLNP